MAFKGDIYSDKLIVRKYCDSLYKVSFVPHCRDAGWDFDSKVVLPKEVKKLNGRYRNNVSRAKSRFFEYAICNRWDFFVTFTFNADLCNRYDFDDSCRAFLDCVRLINKYRSAERITYLLVPEQHKDGAWHMHGFISGLQCYEVRLNENGYREWIWFREEFGFMNMSPVEDKVASAFYSTKYVFKAPESLPSGCHLYYHSRGLERSKVVYSGSGLYLGNFDYVSDFGVGSSYVDCIDSSFFDFDVSNL